MRRTLVLDTSALLSGRPAEALPGAVIPPEVARELESDERSRTLLGLLRASGLRIVDSSLESRRVIERGARETGDLEALSEADLAVLALAWEIQGEIVTDDYRIQNVSLHLGIPFQGRGERGIAERWVWRLRCRSCLRWAPQGLKECPTCGGSLRLVRHRPSEGSPAPQRS